MNTVGFQSAPIEVEMNYSWLPARPSDKKDDVQLVAADPVNEVETTLDHQSHQRDEHHTNTGAATHSHQQQQSHEEAPPPHGVCYQYYYHGSCDRSGCPYRHARPTSQAQSFQSRGPLDEPSSQYSSSQAREYSAGTPRTTNGEQYRQESYSSSAGNYYDEQRGDASGSYGRRSPSYPHTTTRFDNHNNDSEYFGADRTYRPRGFQANKPCFSYQRGGYCKFGSQCAFSHDMNDCSQPR